MVPRPREDSDHVYYVYRLLFDAAAWGIPRSRFVEAVAAEGIPITGGYVKPLYLSPLYQERRASAFPGYRGNARYEPGLCPVAERLHRETLLLLDVVRPRADQRDMDDIVAVIEKVWERRSDLR